MIGSHTRLPAGLRLRLGRSLLAIPGIYLAAACALAVAAPAVDRRRHEPGATDMGIARDILTSAATGMIAFTGFVLTGMLVVVQFAAGQYSPRLVLFFRHDVLIKHAIGVFLASFLYALVALQALDGEVVDFTPQATVGVALALMLAACVLFLVLLQRVTDRIRPRALYASVVRAGMRAARETYPLALREAGLRPADRSWARPDPVLVTRRAPAGVVVSFDRSALVRIAARAGATLELVPAVGESVGPGDALVRIHGGEVDPRRLRRCVLIAEERTIEQDPAFAVRIIVDTAIRALSPAVNDPTTAVHAIDALEVFLRDLAARDLETSLAHDDRGAIRLVWRTPSWPDLLDLAFDEIRHYGAGSLQVCRRLRAVLEDLRDDTPPLRHTAIDRHVGDLDVAVLATFAAGSPERELALAADRMGVGLAR